MNLHTTAPMNTKLMETNIAQQARIAELELVIVRKDREIARLNAALGNPLGLDEEDADVS